MLSRMASLSSRRRRSMIDTSSPTSGSSTSSLEDLSIVASKKEDLQECLHQIQEKWMLPQTVARSFKDRGVCTFSFEGRQVVMKLASQEEGDQLSCFLTCPLTTTTAPPLQKALEWNYHLMRKPKTRRFLVAVHPKTAQLILQYQYEHFQNPLEERTATNLEGAIQQLCQKAKRIEADLKAHSASNSSSSSNNNKSSSLSDDHLERRVSPVARFVSPPPLQDEEDSMKTPRISNRRKTPLEPKPSSRRPSLGMSQATPNHRILSVDKEGEWKPQKTGDISFSNQPKVSPPRTLLSVIPNTTTTLARRSPTRTQSTFYLPPAKMMTTTTPKRHLKSSASSLSLRSTLRWSFRVNHHPPKTRNMLKRLVRVVSKVALVDKKRHC